MHRSEWCRSRRELSNAYFLANFGIDTADNEPFQVCPLSAYRSPRFVHGDIAAEGDYVLIPEGMSAETTVDMLKEVNAKVRKLVWFREMKRANKSRVSFKWEPFSVSPIGHELPALVETKGKIGK